MKGAGRAGGAPARLPVPGPGPASRPGAEQTGAARPGGAGRARGGLPREAVRGLEERCGG
ncbi:hypothetical protein GCM10018781_45380 [Kitasatospora indigofera]|uniref:Uncharacterized protein n=1 Tax=Kitasatospora indigofera TaxID=67307 RepID=A0A919G220_9ACTN|nr:hypothetical protein GCM10018781_45380 [Kitasatospora indigofera]